MANLNKVFLIGNLTRDPELRYTPSGMANTEFGIAINRSWKAANGEKREEVCFVDCQAWARSAEVISEYCKKGRPIFVEGRLQLSSWEGKDGQKHSKMRVVVDNFQFLGGPGGAGGPGGERRGPEDASSGAPVRRPAPERRPSPPSREPPSSSSEEPSGEPDANYKVDDDIPF